jgi:hypothetical protein
MAKITLVFILFFFFLFITPSFAQSEEEIILNTVQTLFDGFATKDTLALSQVLLPNGQFYSVREDSNQVITKRTPHSDVIKRISMNQKQIREVINNPRVLIHNRVAIVWTPYDFYINEKLSHGGVDAVSLLKTADGWKIAGIIYTVE